MSMGILLCMTKHNNLIRIGLYRSVDYESVTDIGLVTYFVCA